MTASANTPFSPKRAAKQMIKAALVQFAARFGRQRRKGRPGELLILMYHRILPADDPRTRREEPGMWVSPQSFAMHLQLLQQHFHPVRLDDWLRDRAHGRPLPAKAVAITFDDGWQDNYEHAWPLLQKHRIPATIFLVSEMTGTRQRFWPQRMAHILCSIACDHPGQWQHESLDWLRQAATSYRFDQQLPDAGQLSEIIASAKSLSDDIIHARLDRIEQSLGLKENQPADLLSWSQVKEMSDSGLVSMGSHTCRHIRLNDDLDHDSLQHEVLASKQQIEERIGIPVNSFCYPNGDVSAAAAALVSQHYEGAVTTQSGWNTAQTPVFRLQRIGLHEDISNSPAGFLARLSGWL